MVTALNIIAEAELSDGDMAIVEDALNKDVYHVYRGKKNVQPRHDAKGVMRYLMHIIHSLGYKADKEKERADKLEKKVKTLIKLGVAFNNMCAHKTNAVHIDDWILTYSTDGSNLYRHKDDEKNKWRVAKNTQEIIEAVCG